MSLQNEEGQLFGAPMLLEKLAHWMLIAFNGDQARALAAMDRIEAADPDVAETWRNARQTEGLRERVEAFVADAERDGRNDRPQSVAQ